MRILRWLLIVIGAFALALGAAIIVARFADGPLGMIAGGPLKAGDLISEEPDWSFARDLPTIEFQLLEPARSRTTWILEHGGKIYVPCGYMDTTWGRAWKKWPIEAEADGRAVVRIDGKLYPRSLVRIQEGPVIDALTAEINRKYDAQATRSTVDSGSLWLFELAPPSA